MKFRYPGDKKVTFAAKLPRLNPETLVEDWLQREFQVRALNELVWYKIQNYMLALELRSQANICF